MIARLPLHGVLWGSTGVRVGAHPLDRMPLLHRASVVFCRRRSYNSGEARMHRRVSWSQ
jgi:hypothetical protein